MASIRRTPGLLPPTRIVFSIEDDADCDIELTSLSISLSSMSAIVVADKDFVLISTDKGIGQGRCSLLGPINEGTRARDTQDVGRDY